MTDADAAALRSVLRDYLAATIELLDGEHRFYRLQHPTKVAGVPGRLPWNRPGPSEIVELLRYWPLPRRRGAAASQDGALARC